MSESTTTSSLATRDKREVLRAFGSSCSAESHFLIQRPHAIWQQFYNRLQWEGDLVRDILAPTLERMTSSGAKPWMRLQTRLSESKGIISTLRGHTYQVMDCAFGPDGRWLITGSMDGLIRWDSRTGQMLDRIGGQFVIAEADVCRLQPGGTLVGAASHHRIDIFDLETGSRRFRPLEQSGELCDFSPDGRLLACPTERHTIIIWKVTPPFDDEGPLQLATLEGHVADITACLFTPDGRSLLTASRDGTLNLWDTPSGVRRATHPGGDSHGCDTAALSPDGAILITSSSVNGTTFWNADTLTPRGEPVRIHSGIVRKIAVSHAGDYAVSGDLHGLLVIWDVKTGRLLHVMAEHTGRVSDCAISPDDSIIASVSWDRTLRLWDAHTGEQRALLRGHEAQIWACAFSPGGSLVATASGDYTAKIWDAHSRTIDAQPVGHDGPVNVCGYGPHGDLAVTGGADGVVHMWNTLDGWDAGKFALRSGEITACAVRPDGKRVAIGTATGHVELRELAPQEGGRVVAASHNERIVAMLFTPDGARLISGASDGSLKVRDGMTGEVSHEWHTQRIDVCAMSADGRLLISGGDGILDQWNLRPDEPGPAMLGHSGQIYSCVVSPGGGWAVSTGSDYTLRVWETESGQERALVKRFVSFPSALAASTDGQSLCSGDRDGMLKVWDAQSMQELLSIPAHTNRVDQCAFTPDGRYIVSASLDATLKIWDRATGDEITALSLPGHFMCMTLHPFRPQVFGGDAGGAVYIIDLIGIDYGPLLVSPTCDEDHRLWVRCQHCGQRVEVEQSNLGTVWRCPRVECGGALQINPFVAGAQNNDLPREPEWAIPLPSEPDPAISILDDPEPDDPRSASTLSQRQAQARIVFKTPLWVPRDSPPLKVRYAELAAFKSLLRGILPDQLWETFDVSCHWGNWGLWKQEMRLSPEVILAPYATFTVDDEIWYMSAENNRMSPTGLVWLFFPPAGIPSNYAGHLGWAEDSPPYEEPLFKDFVLEQIRLYRQAHPKRLIVRPARRGWWPFGRRG